MVAELSAQQTYRDVLRWVSSVPRDRATFRSTGVVRTRAVVLCVCVYVMGIRVRRMFIARTLTSSLRRVLALTVLRNEASTSSSHGRHGRG